MYVLSVTKWRDWIWTGQTMIFFLITAVKKMGMIQTLILGGGEHARASQWPSGPLRPLRRLFTVQESGERICNGLCIKLYMLMIYVNSKLYKLRVYLIFQNILLILPKIMRHWKDFRGRFWCFLRKYSWTRNRIIHLFTLLNKNYDFKLWKGGVWPSTDPKAVPVSAAQRLTS